MGVTSAIVLLIVIWFTIAILDTLVSHSNLHLPFFTSPVWATSTRPPLSPTA